ncbi:hypothetical protein [Prolixibacter bellariivorans]|uniref:hypothetical protein n=1 Tax=Prolixibacter bellariivorans TaxID=314319 RepID=UPI000471B6BD|nr:hypothetical protein [Prolixibacter bellariivorans]
MSRLNRRGPENEGAKTGCGLGRCRKPDDNTSKMAYGTGMGKRRKSTGEQGRGQRLQSGLLPGMNK